MPRNRDGPRTSINHIVVTGYEKRRQPSKHYVFAIDVTWDNDERHEILRRYSEFFSLQETLKIIFPDRARSLDKNHALPPLPKRKLIGRSHIESVAEARLESLNQYCQSLIRLDTSVSQCKQVISFLSPKIGDRQLPKLRLNRPASLYPQKRPAGNHVWEEYCVIATFKGEGESQISAESGEQILLLNTDPSGWCLVERKGKIGWIPNSYLKKTKVDIADECLGLIETETQQDVQKEGSPITIETQEYVAIDSYQAQGPGQISFEEGEVILVLDKMEDGWWFVSKDEEEGWVPCGYLESLDNSEVEEDIPTSSLDAEKYVTVAPYTAEEEDEISFTQSLTVEVLQKSLTGWWFIRCNGQMGLAPATYLRKIEDHQEAMSISSDSGVESGSEKHEGLSNFKQVPRQHTVRKKRSTKKGNDKRKFVPKTLIKEEEIDGQETTRQGSPPIKSKNQLPPTIPEETERARKSSDPTSRTKPLVPPKKFSHPEMDSEQYRPSVSSKPVKKTQPSITEKTKSETPYTPPRPRQSRINRAWGGGGGVEQKTHPPIVDEDSDDERKRHRGFSPSRLFGRKSPSPRNSPRASPSSRRRDDSNSLSPPSFEEKRSNLDQGGASPTGGVNPFTQTMVDSMLKYILASDDPGLKAALCNVIRSDPQMMEELRK